MNRRPSDDDKQYRRGVVLGLTFAEVLLLLIFVLMLILAARLFAMTKRANGETARRTQAEHTLNALRPILAKIGTPQDKFDITKEWVRLHDEAARAKAELQDSKPVLDLVEKRQKEAAGKTKLQVASQLAADADLGRKMAQAAGEMFPNQSISHSLDLFRQAARVGKSMVGKSSGQNTLANQFSSCVANLDTCKAQSANLSARLGGVLPPCWADAAGNPQYIFDTHLKEDGIWVTDNHVPGRESDQAVLSVSDFAFDRAMSQQGFVHAGLPMLQFSKKNDCRFYVRVFDDTGAQSKLRYKELLKGVEGIFYKLLMQ